MQDIRQIMPADYIPEPKQHTREQIYTPGQIANMERVNREILVRNAMIDLRVYQDRVLAMRAVIINQVMIEVDNDRTIFLAANDFIYQWRKVPTLIFGRMVLNEVLKKAFPPKVKSAIQAPRNAMLLHASGVQTNVKVEESGEEKQYTNGLII